ncbi:MAG TPA: alanyl-tRNA editing protein [Candidatus Nanoarchaeia archaeon]|nr:alanyl-tRNA editing protein [Candidatus Nanoarchaeia archaeon]
MTRQLYLEDAYRRVFDAKVVNICEEGIILDQTLFYPAGGGQPSDKGAIRKGASSYPVSEVSKKGKDILHRIEGNGLAAGDSVTGQIDWDRRYRLMRIHTAAHIISGIASKEFHAKITGNQLEIERGRIDFDLERFSPDVVSMLFEKSNEIVRGDLALKTYDMAREEIEKDPEMVKLAMGLPPHLKVLRIVDIIGFDRQPDGGTHVKSTKEVGDIGFLRSENKGKNNRRVYFTIP